MFTNNKWKIFFFIALLLSLILTFIPSTEIVLFPFRLFSTYIHELFHVFASLLTGGKDVKFQINMDTSGLTRNANGLRLLIIPAGYIGTSFLGGLLLIISSLRNSVKITFIFLGIIMLISVLFFGLTTLLTIVFGIGVGFLFLFIGFSLKGNLQRFLLAFLSIQLSFNSLEDIKTLIFHSANNNGMSDAYAMSKEVLPFPPVIWAIIFALISLTILYFSLGFAFKNREKNNTFINHQNNSTTITKSY